MQRDEEYETELRELPPPRPMRKRKAKKLAYGLASKLIRDRIKLSTVNLVLEIEARDARLVRLCVEEIADMLERKQGREWLCFRDNEPERSLL